MNGYSSTTPREQQKELRPTARNMQTLEDLFKELGYQVRYEKGHFKPGSCLLHQQGLVVLNKLATLDVQMQQLIALLPRVVQELKEKGSWELIYKNLDPRNRVLMGHLDRGSG